jgi:uncharacterized protein YydD (DUF2326 family)
MNSEKIYEFSNLLLGRFYRNFDELVVNFKNLLLKRFEHLKELVRKIERNSHSYTEELLSIKTKLSL